MSDTQRRSPGCRGAGLFISLPTLAIWSSALDFRITSACGSLTFYRGYLQGRLREAYPQGRLFLGARLGPAFFFTAALFAIGHLSIFHGWRLAVFFPALLFGWLRERTGTVLGASLLHAGFNLYEMTLRSSFFGWLWFQVPS